MNIVAETKVLADDSESLDIFGRAVAIADGIAVIGASSKADATGAAYLFDSQGNEIIKLLGSDSDPGDTFGEAVAIDSQFSIVGASEHDLPVPGAGAVYVFNVIPEPSALAFLMGGGIICLSGQRLPSVSSGPDIR